MRFKRDSQSLGYLLELYNGSGFEILCRSREVAIKFYTVLLEYGYKPFNNFEYASKCNYILISINSIKCKEFGTMGINDLVEFFEIEDTPQEIDCYFGANVFISTEIGQKKINVAALKDIINSYIGNFNFKMKIDRVVQWCDGVDVICIFTEKLYKDSNNISSYTISIDYSNLDNLVILFTLSNIPKGILYNYQTDYIRKNLTKFVRSSNFFIGA